MGTVNKRNFNRLRAAWDKRNATWLEYAEPEIERALREELADGANPEELDGFINEISGDQEWFSKRVKGAARHLHSQQTR